MRPQGHSASSPRPGVAATDRLGNSGLDEPMLLARYRPWVQCLLSSLRCPAQPGLKAGQLPGSRSGPLSSAPGPWRLLESLALGRVNPSGAQPSLNLPSLSSDWLCTQELSQGIATSGLFSFSPGRVTPVCPLPHVDQGRWTGSEYEEVGDCPLAGVWVSWKVGYI